MKTALLPASRVARSLRQRVESLLHRGETVSGSIEAAVTQRADARAAQRSFVKCGLAAERSADWATPGEVFTAVRKAAARARRKRQR